MKMKLRYFQSYEDISGSLLNHSNFINKYVF